MSLSLSVSRAALVAGVLVLGLAACGRRGALEAPPDPAAPQVQQGAQGAQAGDTNDNTNVAGGTLPSPVGTPRSRARQGIVIPKEPFILDPLL